MIVGDAIRAARYRAMTWLAIRAANVSAWALRHPWRTGYRRWGQSEPTWREQRSEGE